MSSENLEGKLGVVDKIKFAGKLFLNYPQYFSEKYDATHEGKYVTAPLIIAFGECLSYGLLSSIVAQDVAPFVAGTTWMARFTEHLVSDDLITLGKPWFTNKETVVKA